MYMTVLTLNDTMSLQRLVLCMRTTAAIRMYVLRQFAVPLVPTFIAPDFHSCSALMMPAAMVKHMPKNDMANDQLTSKSNSTSLL